MTRFKFFFFIKNSAKAKSAYRSAALAGLLVGAIGSGCAHKESSGSAADAVKADGTTPPGPAPAAWAAKMQSLSTTLSDLLPLIASPTKFSALENQDRVEADIKSLRSLSHSLGDKSVQKPNADPTMNMVSGLFAEDIDRAAEAMHSGNREYARSILRDTANYCVSCHTQTNNGPSYPRLSLDVQTRDLPRLERAEFYAATRQFDAAVSEFKKALDEAAFDKKDSFAWERTARSALAILIRVEKKPDDAIKFTESLSKNPKAPEDLKKQASGWTKSLKDWKHERLPIAPSPSERLRHAAALVARAQLAQKYPLDHSQDVLWFRAGAILHDLMSQNERAPDFASRALYLAGLASEATRDMNFWTMHETYYELCISKDPHSKQARQCFDRLVDSVTMGYSGSAGVSIPAEVQKRLEHYRELAAIEAPQKPGGGASGPKLSNPDKQP